MTTIRDAVCRAATRTGCAVAFSAVLAVGVFPSPARAQTSPDQDREVVGRNYFIGNAAHNGYWNGFARGAEDFRNGPDARSQFDMSFIRADAGYTVAMGSLGDYQRAFRDAYARGYDDGRAGHARDPLANVPPTPPEPVLASGILPRRADGAGDNLLAFASARGYDAGYTKGTDDRARGAGFGYRGDESYREVNNGSGTSLDDENRYQSMFRQLYARGYSDGFNGRERYTATALLADGRHDARGEAAVDPSHAIRQAADEGYRNGYERGRHDREQGRKRPNPKGHDAYQVALDGWKPASGDRSSYRRDFRREFVRGYDDGFHGRASTLVSP